MDFKKLDELSSGLDDLTVTVDELIDESDSMDRKQLDEVHKAIETASDTVDEIDDAE
jgi:methyl-accepting chemotaxis protein